MMNTAQPCPESGKLALEPAPLIRKFRRNTRGRDLIVGDIHGFFSKLKQALDGVGFNPAAGDRLFCVGDLVDRGPESEQCLAWIAEPWFHAVAGNHEFMAIDFSQGISSADYYIRNGGEWIIQSSISERSLYSQAFASLPLAIELETEAGPVGIVHAECPYSDWNLFANTLWDFTREDANEVEHLIPMSVWKRDRMMTQDTSVVSGVRAVVVGHSTVQEKCVLGNTIYIDTGGWCGGDFCILDAETLAPAGRG